MRPVRPPWTRRQREQLRHLVNYVEYFQEKIAELSAANRRVPKVLHDAINLLPAVKNRIENSDFDSPAELWREIDDRIAQWHVQESKHWKLRPPDPRPGSHPN